MQVRLKLAEFLNQHNDGGRGVVKRLADYTGLERHKISALLKGDVKYVGFDALAKVCEYLVEQHRLSPGDLPALLFDFEPEQFFAHVAGRKHLEVVLGVRKIKEAIKPGPSKQDTRKPRRFTQRWVMASDSVLHGAVLHESFGRGQQRWRTHPESLEQRLVPAFEGPHGLKQLKRESEAVYDNFLQLELDRACVSIGSVKCNGVTELMAAGAFDTVPFAPQDDVASPQRRSCPFFFRFRDDDPHPPSCCGGLRLARRQRTPQAGIYYEKADKRWDCCPAGRDEDAALVLFVHHIREIRLDIIMAGFSGRATRCLGANLWKLTGDLWPPSFQRKHLHVGVFICRFRFAPPSGDSEDDPDALWSADPIDTEVIPLDASVLERRLG